MANFLSLLESGEGADLELICGQTTFRVHRHMVGAKSEMLRKACNSNMLEGTTGVIEVNITDPVTLLRMLTFIYTGEYDIDFDFDGRTYGLKDQMVPTPDYKCSAEMKIPNEQRRANKLDEADSTTMDKTDRGQGLERENNAKDIPDANRRLIVHAQMYAAADYYLMPSLKELTIQKFKEAIKSRDLRQFIRVIEYVFSTTSEADKGLRNIVITNAAADGVALLAQPGFSRSAAKVAGFFGPFLWLLLNLMAATIRKERTERVSLVNKIRDLQKKIVEFQDALGRTGRGKSFTVFCRYCSRQRPHKLDLNIWKLQCLCGITISEDIVIQA